MKARKGAGIYLIRNFPRPEIPDLGIPNTRLDIAIPAGL